MEYLSAKEARIQTNRINTKEIDKELGVVFEGIKGSINRGEDLFEILEHKVCEESLEKLKELGYTIVSESKKQYDTRHEMYENDFYIIKW